jgi:hypothetical protein
MWLGRLAAAKVNSHGVDAICVDDGKVITTSLFRVVANIAYPMTKLYPEAKGLETDFLKVVIVPALSITNETV